MPAAKYLLDPTIHALQSTPHVTSPLNALLDGNTAPYVRDPTRLACAFPNAMGLLPLHAAAAANDMATISMLLALGAPIDAGDDDGNTALHFAVLAAHVDATSVLVRSGANPDAINIVHTAPIHDLARFGGSDVARRAILAVLVRRGVNLLVRNAYGNTAAHRAVFHGNHDMLDAFVRNAPDLGAMENARGFTPLDLAYGVQNFTMIKSLRARGAVHGSAWGKNLTVEACDLSERQGWAAFQRTSPRTAKHGATARP